MACGIRLGSGPISSARMAGLAIRSGVAGLHLAARSAYTGSLPVRHLCRASPCTAAKTSLPARTFASGAREGFARSGPHCAPRLARQSTLGLGMRPAGIRSARPGHGNSLRLPVRKYASQPPAQSSVGGDVGLVCMYGWRAVCEQYAVTVRFRS